MVNDKELRTGNWLQHVNGKYYQYSTYEEACEVAIKYGLENLI